MSTPAYDRRRWAPAGPKMIRCLRCGRLVSSNALARAAHERGDRCAPKSPLVAHKK